MGGAVSSGVDNDDLVDQLANAGYIRSKLVERIFRAVDRGHYYTETPPFSKDNRDGETLEADVERRKTAYRDMAWKFGLLHLSAPCVYSQVVESLDLHPGLSFLNLGSGTGYLSTVVGLIIGPTGVNHGVEIHEEVVQYANWKLQEFKQSSDALYEFELCEPKFTVGNCLCLDSEVMQYDRVYCGAACPESYENYMKNLLKVGGILVMPLNHQLMQITRLSETMWETVAVLPVSFASLILPVPTNSSSSKESNQSIKLPTLEPLCLQEACRHLVRTLIRQKMEREHPILCKRSYVRRIKQKLKKDSEDLESDRRHGDLARKSGESSGSRQSSSRDGNNDGCLRSLGLVVFRELEGMQNMDQVLTLIHVNRRLVGREAQRGTALRRTFLRTAFRMGEDVRVDELDSFSDSSTSSSSSSSSSSSTSSTSSGIHEDEDGLDGYLSDDGLSGEDMSFPSRVTNALERSAEADNTAQDEDKICESKVKRLRLQSNKHDSGLYSVETKEAVSSKSSKQPNEYPKKRYLNSSSCSQSDQTDEETDKVNIKMPCDVVPCSKMKNPKQRTSFMAPSSANSNMGEECIQVKDEQESIPSKQSNPCATASFIDKKESNISFAEEPITKEFQSQSEDTCNEREEAMSISSDTHLPIQSSENGSNEDFVKASNSSEFEENSYSGCNNCENNSSSDEGNKRMEKEEIPLSGDKFCDVSSDVLNGDSEKEKNQNVSDNADEKDPNDGITYSKLMRASIQSLPLPPMLKLYLNYQRPL